MEINSFRHDLLLNANYPSPSLPLWVSANHEPSARGLSFIFANWLNFIPSHETPRTKDPSSSQPMGGGVCSFLCPVPYVL